MGFEADSRGILVENPGNDIFADLADFYRKEKRFDEGISLCLAGLSANSACAKGRLVLARIFYESGFRPFAVRELGELCQQQPSNKSIRRLLELLGHAEFSVSGDSSASREFTVAETDFDIDDIE